MGGRFFFFFNDTATTEIYTLSLHDALPISDRTRCRLAARRRRRRPLGRAPRRPLGRHRSEEHTSELQSQSNLVCRLLLEKKNNVGAHQLQPLLLERVALGKHPYPPRDHPQP